MKKKIYAVEKAGSNTIIVSRAVLASTFVKKLKGLLMTDGIEEDEGLIIENCNSIHSFFMRYSFDAVFISKDFQVLDMVRYFRPYRVSRIIKGGYYVLELKAGTIDKSGLKIGDIVSFRLL
ncbi:MAG: hypothetical protein A2X49_00165 [Lentisphaerae bacterium GWF2_52_8]|nr:MAG: hypothetical protein A2X49_00165 [Lentisphaerae bacterium GWF2_52_8]